MNIVTIVSFLLGLVAGMIALALFLPSLNKRSEARHRLQLEEHEAMVSDLRQERADDRETNRRLRHELATKTPANFEAVLDERDRSVAERDALRIELQNATTELANRDRSLREARLAIHDIRVQLERDRIGGSEEPGFDPARAVTTGPVAVTNDGDANPTEPAVASAAQTSTRAAAERVEAGELAAEIVEALPAEPDVGRGVSTAGAFDAVSIPEPTVDVANSVPTDFGQHDAVDADANDVPVDLDGTGFSEEGQEPEPSTVFFGDYPLGGSAAN